MNWLSAFDVIPLAVIVLCAGDELRQVVARRQPLMALLLVFIAVGAFHMLATKLHGATTSWWQLLIDVILAVLFVLSVASAEGFRQKNRRSRRSQHSQTQG